MFQQEITNVKPLKLMQIYTFFRKWQTFFQKSRFFFHGNLGFVGFAFRKKKCPILMNRTCTFFRIICCPGRTRTLTNRARIWRATITQQDNLSHFLRLQNYNFFFNWQNSFRFFSANSKKRLSFSPFHFHFFTGKACFFRKKTYLCKVFQEKKQ